MGREREMHAVRGGAGGGVFCGGHARGEMVDKNNSDYRHIFDTCTDLMTKIQSIPQPVIAEVQGTATAAGCQLLATCDPAVASDTAAFATPGVNPGLLCTTPIVALTSAVGAKRGLHM